MQLEVIDEKDDADELTVIKVIGVGGGGCNAVNRMIESGIRDIHFISANTDKQALRKSKAAEKLILGKNLTRGLGAGGRPEVGEKAALEDKEGIKECLRGADMVFITAGMGGGTGTGGAPVIAQIARELDILTVGVVTTPFELEGSVKRRYAEEGLKKLREHVDTLIVIPNENLIKNIDQKISLSQAFLMADDVLRQGILGISTLITGQGEINIDFADVKTIMKDKGDAIMGIGTGHGANKANDAITNAIYNKVMQDSRIDGATGILLGITGGSDFSITEFHEILQMVSSTASDDAHIIWGQTTDENLQDEVSVIVIATGFSRVDEQNYAGESGGQEKNDTVMSIDEWNGLQKGLSKKNENKAAVGRITSRDDIDIPAIFRNRKNLEAVKNGI